MASEGKGKRRTLAQRRSSRGRTSQARGRSWQKVVAKILSYITRVGEDEFFSNQGGDKGDIDVHMSAAAKASFPFWIECKDTKTLSVKEWVRKLDEDRKAAKCVEAGIIISKLSGTSRALVMIELPDFLDALYGPLSQSQKERITALIRKVKEA